MEECNNNQLIRNVTNTQKMASLRLRKTKSFQRVFDNRYDDNFNSSSSKWGAKETALMENLNFAVNCMTVMAKCCEASDDGEYYFRSGCSVGWSEKIKF